MPVPIISRAQWGAKPWQGTVHRVGIAEKTAFLVHYHGGRVSQQTGVAVPRNIERIHLANGWSGIGYNFAVDMNGKVYEGRGWDGVGAQCPGFNRSGIGVYVAVGGDQKPTDAALLTVRALYDEHTRRHGSAPRKMGHRDGVATACPGSILYAWVRAGMPRPSLGGGNSAPAPTSPKPPTLPTQKPTALGIDGKLGPATIRKWQKVMGTEPDGVISRPSELIRAVQRRLNTKGARLVVDGKFGPATIRALQRHLGTEVDGVISRPSEAVKALQRRLNLNRF